ncbi:HNH endonuclease, partial [bacterium]|nr:HNH endonuclease [bacterium]
MARSALRSTGSTDRWRKIRVKILQRDQYVCQYCGQDATTVDHIIPRSKGGNDLPDNLI